MMSDSPTLSGSSKLRQPSHPSGPTQSWKAFYKELNLKNDKMRNSNSWKKGIKISQSYQLNFTYQVLLTPEGCCLDPQCRIKRFLLFHILIGRALHKLWLRLFQAGKLVTSFLNECELRRYLLLSFLCTFNCILY